MKLGICAGSNFIEKLDASLVDYIEMNLTSITKMEENEFSNTLEIIRNSPIPAEAANCFFSLRHKASCGYLSYGKRG